MQGRLCGCNCGDEVVSKKHRCTCPNHDKKTSVYLFGAFCQISDDYNGICRACDRRDSSTTSESAAIQDIENSGDKAAHSNLSVLSAEVIDFLFSDVF